MPTEIPWQCRDRVLICGAQPRVMGILNVTPDSFSDGGRFSDLAAAVAHGLDMAAAGADILDIGGESTRPGADGVPAEEELRRVVPVIRDLRARTGALLAVDTRKAAVARAALAAGADIVNDVSAGAFDMDMAGVVREYRAGFVAMHMRGEPRTMQAAPEYADVVAEVRGGLAARLAALTAAGVPLECLAVDPGIGFGKTLAHNLALLRALPGLRCGRPLVAGVSRKQWVGALTGRSQPAERLGGSLAAALWALAHGVDVVRVHDVRETVDALRVWAALEQNGWE